MVQNNTNVAWKCLRLLGCRPLRPASQTFFAKRLRHTCIMQFSSPVTRNFQPKYNPGSNLRSLRDSDAVASQWKKSKKVGNSAFGSDVAITRLQVEFQKLRRRILGGQGTQAASQSTSNDRGIWTPVPSSPYMTYDKVILQTGTATGYYISTIDNNPNAPDSGIGWVQLSNSQGVWL